MRCNFIWCSITYYMAKQNWIFYIVQSDRNILHLGLLILIAWWQNLKSALEIGLVLPCRNHFYASVRLRP